MLGNGELLQTSEDILVNLGARSSGQMLEKPVLRDGYSQEPNMHPEGGRERPISRPQALPQSSEELLEGPQSSLWAFWGVRCRIATSSSTLPIALQAPATPP